MRYAAFCYFISSMVTSYAMQDLQKQAAPFAFTVAAILSGASVYNFYQYHQKVTAKKKTLYTLLQSKCILEAYMEQNFITTHFQEFSAFCEKHHQHCIIPHEKADEVPEILYETLEAEPLCAEKPILQNLKELSAHAHENHEKNGVAGCQFCKEKVPPIIEQLDELKQQRHDVRHRSQRVFGLKLGLAAIGASLYGIYSLMRPAR